MADIDTGGGGGKHKGGKVKAKKMSTRVDFTPMVDLGFLLITFFMLTTTLNKPQSMELNMPEKDVKKDEQQKINDEQAITILLGKNDKVYYYAGMPPADGTPPQLTESSFDPKTGIRKYLLERNARVLNEIKPLRAKLQAGQMSEDQYRKALAEVKKNDVKGIVVLMKAHKESKYKNMVDILDEMAICNVPRYAIVDIAPTEAIILDNIK